MVKEDIIIEQLYVHFPVAGGSVRAVDGISLKLEQGQFTAIVGESGCGKSVLGQALLDALPRSAQVKGKVTIGTRPLVGKKLYGKALGLVPQNPEASFCPSRPIGKQMEDILEAAGLKDRDNKIKLFWLDFFGLKEGEKVLASYGHQLSGGMQQRALCAMAMCTKPRWLLADEPTKGLDEKVCNVVYENLLEIKKAGQASMVIITHDIDLAKSCCDKIAMMYGGQILEYSPYLLARPLHPYTKAFLGSLPENGFQPLEGRAPEPTENIRGCKFAPPLQGGLPAML